MQLCWLLHTPPSAMWPSSHLDSLSFISLLCHPFPLLHYQNTDLPASFLALLSATLFPPLMVRSTSGQRASPGSRVLYFQRIITCAAVFLSVVASLLLLRGCNTRGTRQGNIKHATRTRPITPIRVLNPPKADNHPPNMSLGFHPLQIWGWGHGQSSSFSLWFFYMTFPLSSTGKRSCLWLNFPETPPSEASRKSRPKQFW
jgi:hypothetical protein